MLLSGDVHYSASTVMSYWTKGDAEPARFVQFTSSGFKNVMPSYITTVDRSLRSRTASSAPTSAPSAWAGDVKPSNPVLLPAGKSEADIPRELRAKLKTRADAAADLRLAGGHDDQSGAAAGLVVARGADLRRPARRRRARRRFGRSSIDDGRRSDARGRATRRARSKATRPLAARQQRALETLRNSRQILFRSNFGLVRFERRDGVLHAIHEMYTAARLPEDVGSAVLKPELFVLHAAALDTPEAVRPEQLSLQTISADEPRVTTPAPV